ncbi:uncharacterized protein LOC135211721 isoform X3 [Macrobrachium nipponense]|uniref:uncharacterized protein LOC135211721 isoform X3 n=1 Tax=Macrobrachium nipponense TaxID=159736 RepID=UPI0030C8307A
MILQLVMTMMKMIAISSFMELPVGISAAQILQANLASPRLTDRRTKKLKYEEYDKKIKIDDSPSSFSEQRKLISIPLFETAEEFNITGAAGGGGSPLLVANPSDSSSKANPLHSLTLVVTLAVPIFAWFLIVPLAIGYRYLFEYILGDAEFLAIFGGPEGAGPMYLVVDNFLNVFY